MMTYIGMGALLVGCFMLAIGWQSGVKGKLMGQGVILIVAGACIGFLVFNWYPAKMFMGDTGSMFLGGAVVAFAFGVDRPIYLMLAGIIYLVEAFSVILQVVYFKKTGKRLFKMSPIHHHFEKSGWSEVKIVISFSIVTLVACGICVAGVAL